MKFLVFAAFDAAKAAEVAQANDKMAKTPGRKVLAQYMCMGMAFAGLPLNTMLGVSVVEYESNEAMAAGQYPATLAGATLWSVPVLEMPVGGLAAEEKKYRK
ncbi:MAG TPA: hypothetical protein VEG43_03650 [Dehalococcoidia bacterium]|nr:hypothetical protein [Dehalococcoidia bacterium]